MGYYLLDHPQVVKQYGVRRRHGASASGTCVIHTAENVTDFSGPDYGAENVASWMTRRTNYGSYHSLCDADSRLKLLPWWYEAWQDTRTNNWSVGISGAIQSAHWDELGARGHAIVANMALEAADFAAWIKEDLGVIVPAARITRAQALARVPGFIGHGEIDTGRRSDPGVEFQWGLFLSLYSEATHHPVIAPPSQPKPRDWLQQGDYDNAEVLHYQKILKQLGYYTGELDSDFGPAMLQATKDFQVANGLDPDGFIGPKTKAVANSGKAKPKASRADSGELQVTGVLDRATILALQKAMGTTRDGFISGMYSKGGRVGNSKRSELVTALQHKFGTYPDGVISTPESQLVMAMQRHFGTTQDGYISAGYSNLVAKIQRSLNAGTF